MKQTTAHALKKSRKLKLGKVTISKLNTLPPILVDGPGQSTHPVCDFTQVTTVIDAAVF